MHDREDVLAREKGWAREETLDREQEQRAVLAREEVQARIETLDREEVPAREDGVAREEDQREMLAREQELFSLLSGVLGGDTGGSVPRLSLYFNLGVIKHGFQDEL